MRTLILALALMAALTPVFAQDNASVSMQSLNVYPQRLFVGDYAVVSVTIYNPTDRCVKINSLDIYGEGITPESLSLGYVPPKSTHTLSFSVRAVESGVHNVGIVLNTEEGSISSFFTLFVEDKMPEIYFKGTVRLGEINNLTLVISSPVEIENVAIAPLFESQPNKIVLKSVSGLAEVPIVFYGNEGSYKFRISFYSGNNYHSYIAEINPRTESARGLAINFSAPFTAVSLYDVVEIDLEITNLMSDSLSSVKLSAYSNSGKVLLSASEIPEIAAGEKKNVKLLYSPERAGEDKIKLEIAYRDSLGGEGRIEREIGEIRVNNETAVKIVGVDISTRRIATTTTAGGFPAGRAATTTTTPVMEITVSGEVANGGFGQARNVIVYLDFGNRTEEFFIGTISPSDSDSFSIPATGSERNVRITVEWINDLGEIHKISKTYQLTQRSFDFGQRESSIFSSLNIAILAILAVAAVAGILFYRRRRGRR
ncbi:MAG: hypothetical protein DSO01_07835 [Archaeoglobi archaeon]|nr:MAG: hypothetical protein DSO01_07835 [Archaeoglobi archaeon]TDA25438.1 MAG: hypothetical protein DSN99_08285 [Archaeoglobi archaeon]